MLARIMRDQRDLLLFRSIKPDLKNHFSAYFVWGLAVTWLAGIGRYWDHPNAETWQYLGLGSVAYVFVLSMLLWLVVLPLRPKRWDYGTVLIFVMFTSLPALLYATPVERFMPLRDAQTANFWFLAIVATWRVALLFKFIHATTGFGLGRSTLTVLLPLALIVTALTALNLEKAVFDIMGGAMKPTSNDAAYEVVWLISVVSVLASPVLVIAYLVAIIRAQPEKPPLP